MVPQGELAAVETHFHEAFLTAQRKSWPACVKFFKLPELNSNVLKIPVAKSIGGISGISVTVEEYMDYLYLPDMADGLTIRKRATQLGLQCAVAWNCLTANASKKGGSDPVTGGVGLVYVTELTDVKFNMVINNEPSWVAFRFRFAHYVLEK